MKESASYPSRIAGGVALLAAVMFPGGSYASDATPENRTPGPFAPLQIMNGPAFTDLLRIVEHDCPATKVRYATPAAFLDAEEEFVAGLNDFDERRLAQAAPKTPSGEFPACVDHDGASCPAGQQMEAFRKAGLTPRFARLICKRGPAAW